MAAAVSSRSLNLAWSTPTDASAAHVATVTTDPVTAGDSSTVSTWTYGYRTGSQHQNASLDLDADVMWPLTEASGTSGKGAVLANEATKNATYENVTLGATGPLTGSSSTAASFDGTTSDVSLSKNTGNDTDSGALSRWFKASAGPGVLYSYASQAIGSGQAASFYTSSIYLASGHHPGPSGSG